MFSLISGGSCLWRTKARGMRGWLTKPFISCQCVPYKNTFPIRASLRGRGTHTHTHTHTHTQSQMVEMVEITQSQSEGSWNTDSGSHAIIIMPVPVSISIQPISNDLLLLLQRSTLCVVRDFRQHVKLKTANIPTLTTRSIFRLCRLLLSVI